MSYIVVSAQDLRNHLEEELRKIMTAEQAAKEKKQKDILKWEEETKPVRKILAQVAIMALEDYQNTTAKTDVFPPDYSESYMSLRIYHQPSQKLMAFLDANKNLTYTTTHKGWLFRKFVRIHIETANYIQYPNNPTSWTISPHQLRRPQIEKSLNELPENGVVHLDTDKADKIGYSYQTQDVIHVIQ